MIRKQNAKQAGVKIVDSRELFGEGKTALLEQLKALLPAIINSDNQLDSKALRDVVDIAGTTSNNQGYELTFAGKGLARAEAGTPTEYELKTERGQSKDFDNTDNVVIRGDNIDVLKILYQNYHGKIKMIYIDPPYNTKSDNFIYKDNFKSSDEDLIEKFNLDESTSDFLHNVYGTRSHSGWLSFMYPRLKLSRELLADDGVIFISIDDNEQANLKLICDEIFGEENFVQTFTWVKRDKTSGVPPKRMILPNFEYALCYKKNHDIIFLGQDRSLKSYKQDKNGRWWRLMPIQATGSQDNYFSIVDPNTSKSCYGNWAFSEVTVKKMIIEGKIIFPKSDGGKPNQIVYADEKDKSPIFAHLGKIDVEIATKELTKILSRKVFSFPKPVNLLSWLIKQTSSEDATILDFFAGSGTTADAVMQLNAEDGGNRKFILVQWDEAIDKNKNAETYNFCTDNKLAPVISSITIERLNRAGEKIKAELKAETKQGKLIDEGKKLPDIGYKVFSLQEKPQLEEQDDAHATMFSVYSNRKETADTLFNMLSATCKPLHCKIECLIKDVLYRADNELYLLANATEKQVREKLKNYPDLKINLDGWADINLEQYLNLNVANSSNITVIY